MQKAICIVSKFLEQKQENEENAAQRTYGRKAVCMLLFLYEAEENFDSNKRNTTHCFALGRDHIVSQCLA